MSSEIRWGLYRNYTTPDPHVSFERGGRTRSTVLFSQLERIGRLLIDHYDNDKGVWARRNHGEAESHAKRIGATIIAEGPTGTRFEGYYYFFREKPKS